MAGMRKTGVDKALQMIQNMPRVAQNNLTRPPGEPSYYWKLRKSYQEWVQRTRITPLGLHPRRSKMQFNLKPLGFETGRMPNFIISPKEPYYFGHELKRQYPPVSLLTIQRMFDLGWFDPDEPLIDLAALCNTRWLSLNTDWKHAGVHLTDEGIDCFTAKVNIEVQYASQTAIAAVERNGGVITTKFYDMLSVEALKDPEDFFRKGNPIPRCKLPPSDALPYYVSAENRGYLADPALVTKARIELAQKYGYALPDITQDPLFPLLSKRKHPRQVFYDLEPGWVVNLKDEVILKPTDEELKQFYAKGTGGSEEHDSGELSLHDETKETMREGASLTPRKEAQMEQFLRSQHNRSSYEPTVPIVSPPSTVQRVPRNFSQTASILASSSGSRRSHRRRRSSVSSRGVSTRSDTYHCAMVHADRPRQNSSAADLSEEVAITKSSRKRKRRPGILVAGNRKFDPFKHSTPKPDRTVFSPTVRRRRRPSGQSNATASRKSSKNSGKRKVSNESKKIHVRKRRYSSIRPSKTPHIKILLQKPDVVHVAQAQPSDGLDHRKLLDDLPANQFPANHDNIYSIERTTKIFFQKPPVATSTVRPQRPKSMGRRSNRDKLVRFLKEIRDRSPFSPSEAEEENNSTRATIEPTNNSPSTPTTKKKSKKRSSAKSSSRSSTQKRKSTKTSKGKSNDRRTLNKTQETQAKPIELEVNPTPAVHTDVLRSSATSSRHTSEGRRSSHRSSFTSNFTLSSGLSTGKRDSTASATSKSGHNKTVVVGFSNIFSRMKKYIFGR